MPWVIYITCIRYIIIFFYEFFPWNWTNVADMKLYEINDLCTFLFIITADLELNKFIKTYMFFMYWSAHASNTCHFMIIITLFPLHVILTWCQQCIITLITILIVIENTNMHFLSFRCVIFTRHIKIPYGWFKMNSLHMKSICRGII